MKTAQRTALTVALFAALAGGQAMAADFSPASGEFSGADNTVVAQQAAVSGTALTKFNAGDVVAMPASGEFSGTGADATVQSAGLTRQEVRAEVVAMPASGEFSGADQVVTAHAKTREEVRAEVAAARLNGELFIQGDYHVN